MREIVENGKCTPRRREDEFAHFDHRGRPKKNQKFIRESLTSIASTTIVVCGGHFFRTGEVVGFSAVKPPRKRFDLAASASSSSTT